MEDKFNFSPIANENEVGKWKSGPICPLLTANYQLPTTN